jgi:hypothetical protein
MTMLLRQFAGYESLGEVDAPKPAPSGDQGTFFVTAASVRPLEHTVLFGEHPRAEAPLVRRTPDGSKPALPTAIHLHVTDIIVQEAL